MSQNQQDSSKISLRISASESAIKLRWAANNPVLWKSCLQNGFAVERYTISRNGEVLEEREKKILSQGLKPASLDDWEIPATKNEYAAIIAQAIYGDSFETTGMKTDNLQGMIDQTLELEQRYNFALYCADMSFEAATLAGWAFTDDQVVPDECYLYRVIPLDASGRARKEVNYGFDHCCTGEITELPSPIQLHAESGDRSVMLFWNNELMKHFFSAYQIERSSNNQDFIPLGKPFAAIGDERDGYVMYRDSLPENNIPYYYRIRGINPFGEAGSPSDTIRVIGEPVLPYVPQIINGRVNDDGTANIEWTFDEKGNDEIHSFTLMQSARSSGEYYPLISNISKETRNIFFKELLPVNYLVIVAEPLYGKSAGSYPYMLITPDSIPPEAPTGLSAEADSSGIIRIRWNANHEADLEGYRIFKYNLPDEEPVVIIDSLLPEPNYTDSTDLYNLNPYVYYRIKALDKRYNQSEFSLPLQVEKPLKTQPSSPVLTSFRVDKTGIYLEWISCPDEFCAQHILYRKQKDSLQYDLVKLFDGADITSYEDTTVEGGNTYVYFLTAQSKWGVESLPCQALQVTASLSAPSKAIQKIHHKWDPEERQLSLSWEVTGRERIRSYRLFRSENQAPISLWKETEDLFVTDHNLKTGYIYHYQIQAIYSNGRISERKELIINH
jgi:hypothetical protein